MVTYIISGTSDYVKGHISIGLLVVGSKTNMIAGTQVMVVEFYDLEAKKKVDKGYNISWWPMVDSQPLNFYVFEAMSYHDFLFIFSTNS